MNAAIREASLYSVGAGAAFAVDVAVLWALVELTGLHYLPSAAIAFVAGTAVAYWVSVRHAFAYRRVARRQVEFGLFLAVGVIGIALNLSVMYGAVEFLSVHYLIAKVFASALTFFANFTIRKTLLFSPWRTGPRARPTGETKIDR